MDAEYDVLKVVRKLPGPVVMIRIQHFCGDLSVTR
jgi:hypothetical protein